MKKVLLSVLLLLALVAISYFQATRESEQRTRSYRRGQRAGADSVQAAQPDFDSVADLLLRERRALAEYLSLMSDSVAQLDSVYQYSVDSLTGVIGRQSADLSRLRKQSSGGKTPSKAQQAAKAPGSAGPSHEEILSHYKRVMSKLPSDLTDYEYRVAVDEIRTETAAKFSISVEKLNQIRADHSLDF